MAFFAALAPILKGLVGSTVGKAVVGNVATSLVEGVIANRAAKAQRSQELGDVAQQFTRLRDAAEAAGFNPLTALNANPGGGMPNSTPALAGGKFLTDALGAGVKTFFNGDQIARDAERDFLERALMRQELRQMQAQGRSVTERGMSFGFGIPTASNYSGVDRVQAPPGLNPKLTLPGGFETQPNSGSAAQAWSDEYGDVVEMGIGVAKLAYDGFGMLNRWMETPRVSLKAQGRPAPPAPPGVGRVIPESPYTVPYRPGEAFNFHKGRHRPEFLMQ